MNELRKFIEPIKKKWVYHFIVSPKTGAIDKPEWYLNQTLKWIHEHLDNVEAKVSLGPSEAQRAEVRQLFIICMLELVHMRLSKDMKTILDEDESFDAKGKCDTNVSRVKHNEAILIHTYNETIQFVRVIRRLLGTRYESLDEKHDLLAVFSNQKLFEKVIDVEWEFAKKNVNELTSTDQVWDLVLEGDYLDYYKIPRCVDRFLLQIKSISDRVDCFRQIDCKFQLIDLQCFLFEKMLKFMRNSTESAPATKNLISGFLLLADESTIDLSKILRVLNGINFLRLILRERSFISISENQLDEELLEKLNKVSDDYKITFNRLVDKVVNIYKYVDCGLESFLEFVKPKLSHDIFELIRDEASKYYQVRQSKQLLSKAQGLSFG